MGGVGKTWSVPTTECELSEIPQHLRKYFTPKHKRWIARNDIVWAKRNGMPESVTDRFSKKHEYFFFMVKQPKYYFNLDGVRDEAKTTDVSKNGSWKGDRNLTIQPISEKNTLGGVN